MMYFIVFFFLAMCHSPMPVILLSISSSLNLPCKESLKIWTVFSGAEWKVQVPETMQNRCGDPIGLEKSKLN